MAIFVQSKAHFQFLNMKYASKYITGVIDLKKATDRNDLYKNVKPKCVYFLLNSMEHGRIDRKLRRDTREIRWIIGDSMLIACGRFVRAYET